VTFPASDARQRARIGALARWARTGDRVAATAPARAAFMRRFEVQVDPDGRMAPRERTQKAEYARRAHMAALARRSAAVRRGAAQREVAESGIAPRRRRSEVSMNREEAGR
jgi:hypothetical protein